MHASADAERIPAVAAPAPRRKRRWLTAFAVVSAVVGLAAATGKFVGKKEDAAKADASKEVAVSVTTAPATARPVRRVVSAVGSLWGWDEVAVTPKLEGRVVRVYKDVGDAVKPGDRLLDLDPTDCQLAVAEAKRAVELELARLGLTELPAADIDVTRLPGVVRTDSLVKQTDLRIKRLEAGGRAVTDEEVQQASTDAEVAKANHQQAILEAKATLAAARHRHAALATAEQRLKDTTIVAPAPVSLRAAGSAGAEYVVSFRKVAEGEMIRIIPLVDAPPLFRLVIDRPLKLHLTIPERHRTEVALGQRVELEVESYPGERFAAAVSRVNPAVDRASRTFTAEVAVPNADRRLGVGSFVKADIVTRAAASAVTVPEEAVVSFAGITKVFVLEDGHARAILVKTGAATVVPENGRERTWVEVDGPVPPGAAVITSGFAKLADGTAAKVRGE